MGSKFVDHYQVLGLPALTPTADEIKKAYRKVSLQWHPDKIPDKSKSEKAQEKMKQINVSNDILSDSSKRKTYDEEYKTKHPYSYASSPTLAEWDQYYRDQFCRPPGWSSFSSGYSHGYSHGFPPMPEFVFVNRTPSQQQARAPDSCPRDRARPSQQPAADPGTSSPNPRGFQNKENEPWTKEDKPLTPMQNLLLRTYPRESHNKFMIPSVLRQKWARESWEATHLKTAQDWEQYKACEDFILQWCT